MVCVCMFACLCERSFNRRPAESLMKLIKESVPLILMAQILMILHTQPCRGSKKQSFAMGNKRCIKKEFEGYI